MKNKKKSEDVKYTWKDNTSIGFLGPEPNFTWILGFEGEANIQARIYVKKTFWNWLRYKWMFLVLPGSARWDKK